MIRKLILPALLTILSGCSTSSGTDGGNGGGTGKNTGDSSFLPTIQVVNYDCSDATIHCVDDSASPEREFSTIQQAVDIAGPGDVVLVHDGNYSGFRVDNSGIQGSEILITANGNTASITSPNGRSGGDNIYISDADHVIVEGFTVVSAPQLGIASHDASANSPMQGIQIRYNVVSNSGSTNIYLSHSANSTIIGNVTYNSQNSHGIYVTNAGSDNVVIAGNQVFQNNVNGIHFNGDASNGGDGVHTGLTVDSNVIYQNNANGIDADGVYDSKFVNNLVYDNARHGIRVFRIDSSLGAGNLIFANNTIVDNAQTAIKLTADTGGNTFFNNILVGNANGCIYVESQNIVSDNNIFPNNCIFTPNNPSLFFGAASQTSTLLQLFSNSASEDFTLKVGSPAINTGSTSLNGINAPVVDIDNLQRDVSPDIGAYEF